MFDDFSFSLVYASSDQFLIFTYEESFLLNKHVFWLVYDYVVLWFRSIIMFVIVFLCFIDR